MNTALSKKPASVLRTYTQQVRNHAGAMQRIQDQYFAALKRAEAQYFDGVKRITDEVTADAGDVVASSESEATQSEPIAAAS